MNCLGSLTSYFTSMISNSSGISELNTDDLTLSNVKYGLKLPNGRWSSIM